MFGGLELIILPLTLLGVIVLAVVALAGGRGDAGRPGERAHVLYVSIVSFIAIFTILFAFLTVTMNVSKLLFEDAGQSPQRCVTTPTGTTCDLLPEENPFGDDADDAATTNAVNAAAIGAAAAAVLLIHRRKSQAMLSEIGFVESAGARTFVAYLYAVAFTAMLIVLVAGGLALFAVFRVSAPGVSGFDADVERDAGITQLVSSGLLAIAAAFVYRAHARLADRLRKGDALPARRRRPADEGA
ncbi:MAG: hypothetical protein M3273_03920 [Actinomycetota bacterium]|nr:hypothetical protein [Actinomycetota bacterium]